MAGLTLAFRSVGENKINVPALVPIHAQGVLVNRVIRKF